MYMFHEGKVKNTLKRSQNTQYQYAAILVLTDILCYMYEHACIGSQILNVGHVRLRKTIIINLFDTLIIIL